MARAPVVSLPDTTPSHETFSIASVALGERRTINVYTPPGYATSRRTYPVLYMPDGGVGEDFPHIAATIDSLIRLERIWPVIVVGIENTERRRDLTGPTTIGSDSAIARHVGGSAAFRNFIRDELMPAVRQRCRTTDETTIVGESLAGLFVVETLLLEPTLFRSYIAISPSLWWNGGELVRVQARQFHGSGSTVRTLYVASANEAGIADGAASLAASLKALPLAGLRVHYEARPDLQHATIFAALAPEAFVQVLH